jgi:predicted DNA-binding transcriptional regulator YafY
MRRADRFFHLVQLIRGRRLTTAAFLAARLEVSERTVYRDVADLQHQGVPIEGEAGVGYRLAQAWLDPALARDAEQALGKILSILPRQTRAAAESLALYAPSFSVDPAVQQPLQTLREALQSRSAVTLADFLRQAGAPPG